MTKLTKELEMELYVKLYKEAVMELNQDMAEVYLHMIKSISSTSDVTV